MSKEILRVEKQNIATFQKEMYLPETETEKIGTRFSLDFEKKSQANHIKVRMDQVPMKEGEIKYTASQKFDNLLKIEAHITLLPIKVKEEYKKTVTICYHHNLGHNILYEGECKLDNEHYGYLNSQYLDIHSQYFVKKRNLYNRMIGNIPCLEEWNTELPAIPLIVPQPYSFSRNPRVSIPLLKSTKNIVTFEYKVKTKLTDLIKMRVLTKDGVYKVLPICNLKYLETKNATNIPIPEMWGRYSEMTDAERNWRKSIDMKTGEPIKQVIYVEDIEKISSKNPITIGTKETLSLASSIPTKHIFWMAGLTDAGFSNYTTNKNDVYKGYNPCAKAAIKYGSSDRVEECGQEHFSLSEAFDFPWENTPCEDGYNVHTYTFNPNDIQNADTAVNLKECGASLTVLLNDTNPFLNKDEEKEYYNEDGEVIPVEALEDHIDESKKDKFILHVCTVVTRKMEIFWNEKTSSLKYIFTST
jgi:hypothetical protein